MIAEHAGTDKRLVGNWSAIIPVVENKLQWLQRSQVSCKQNQTPRGRGAVASSVGPRFKQLIKYLVQGHHTVTLTVSDSGEARTSNAS